jgi:hypothetical protein
MISFGLFAIIKIAASILIVVSLSLIAERVGPRAAGIISGYPLGAAITLFFIGIEISPDFAADSAVYTAAGLAATVAFVAGYLLGLGWAKKFNPVSGIGISLIPALVAYGLSAWLLSLIPINWIGAVLIATACILSAMWRFRTIANASISEPFRLRFGTTMARAAFAALVILTITTVAQVVGPQWAGFFSAFPSTMMPLLVIVQFTHQPAHVRTIIKNVPRGLQSLLVYVVIVAVTYGRWGIIWGTVSGYAAATLYLLALEYLKFGKRRSMPYALKEKKS